MDPTIAFGLVAFGSVFSIVDPIAALPVYLALTGREDSVAKHQTALRAAMTCLLVLCLFAAVGPAVFRFFGITIPAFRIAGGLLLFRVALDMLHAKVSSTKTTHDEEVDAAGRTDVGVIPVGIPLLSGPGAIASVMMLAGKAQSPTQHLALFLAITLVAILCWLVLRFASFTAKLLGTTGMNLIGRIMGLILAAVAVEFVLEGVREAFPAHFR
jgi:multiple antibiotic resistance protein